MELTQRDARIADLEGSFAEETQRVAMLERQLADRESRVHGLMRVLVRELDEMDSRIAQVERDVADMRRRLRTWLVQALGQVPLEVSPGQEEATSPGPATETLPRREHAEARGIASPASGGRSRASDPRVLRVVEKILAGPPPGDRTG